MVLRECFLAVEVEQVVRPIVLTVVPVANMVAVVELSGN